MNLLTKIQSHYYFTKGKIAKGGFGLVIGSFNTIVG